MVRMRRYFLLAVGVLLVVVLSSTAEATPIRVAVPAAAVAPAFTAKQLTAVPRANWLMVGGSAYNQRYSALKQISSSNVKGLKVAWNTHLSGSGAGNKYSAEGNAVVYNGVMYIITGGDDVFALNAATGQHLWTHRAHLSNKISTACCGWISRGVAIGEGKVFVGQLDGNVVALDQRTGHVVWKTRNGRWQVGETLTAAPAYFDGKVFIGQSGSDYGCRCSETAYSAKTGKRIWQTSMIPGPGQPGGDTWPKTGNWRQHGGAGVWNNPTFDPAKNELVVSTGNADPYVDRPAGNDLFTSSFVAMDINTGKIKWYYQMVHHDLWDYDCPSPTVMFDTTIKGVVRQGIAEACKTVWVYELDRTNGKPLIGIKEVHVPQSAEQHTSPTQPEPVGQAVADQCAPRKYYKGKAPDGAPFKIGCIFLPPTTNRFVAYAPGWNGGDDWAPMSYNPTAHALYVCESNDSVAQEARPLKQIKWIPQVYYGGTNGVNSYKQVKEPLLSWGGTFTALDANTNRIIWQQKWTGSLAHPDYCYSGSFTTAGNLVFVGHNDGTYQADNAKTGKILWSKKLPYGANAPGVTYSVHGKQYVAIYDGGTTGDGEVPSAHGDAVYAFALSR